MQTLITFKKFIDELNLENGRNYKLSVLEKYKDDTTIKYYLEFLLNPYKVTGISDKKLNKITAIHTSLICDGTVLGLLEYLLKHNTGTDEVISEINSFYIINCIPSDLRPILAGLITKNLPIGIEAKSVNKVIPGLIPEFNVQLANKYFEDPDRIIGKEFAITTKIDGGRIIAIKENGEVTFYTRQGQIYTGLIDLEEEMRNYMPDNICLDGEITLLNPGNLTSKDQYKQTMKITRADGEKHNVKMLVFDCMSAEEFRNQKCDSIYTNRRIKLESIFNSYNYTYFNMLPILYRGIDTSKINEFLEIVTAAGGEGIMLNLVDAPYDFTRTWNLQKVKKMHDLDLELIGFEEGTGRNAGKLGAILVDYKGNTVKVGSGFSDELRKEIWEHRDEWIGRTIVVQYFEETSNQKGGISLRFPIYIDYRTDK